MHTSTRALCFVRGSRPLSSRGKAIRPRFVRLYVLSLLDSKLYNFIYSLCFAIFVALNFSLRVQTRARRRTHVSGENSAAEVSVAPTEDGTAGRGDEDEGDADDAELQPVGVDGGVGTGNGTGTGLVSRASVAPAPVSNSPPLAATQGGHPMAVPRPAFVDTDADAGADFSV